MRFSTSPISMKKSSYYQRQVVIIAMIYASGFLSSTTNIRNQVKLRDNQREYARRKRAPGRRKVSKAERQLQEERYMKKKSLMEMEGLVQKPSTQ
jgi:hypothetical protein